MSLAVAPEPSDQEDVRALFALSDAYAASLYPPESNHMVSGDVFATLKARFFVARRQGRAVGCGGVILNADCSGEIKRMFVNPDARGQGVGKALLSAIETAARSEGIRLLRLETGVRNHEALALYRRNGYRDRGPFGSYVADPWSVFMEKTFSV